LYSASSDGFAIQWRKITAQAEQIYDGHDGEVLALVVDEEYVYTSTDTGSIYKRNKTDGSLIMMFSHIDPFRVLSLAIDNNYLYSGGIDYLIRQWDKNTGYLIRIMTGYFLQGFNQFRPFRRCNLYSS
jgi:WD40 repeat protein